MSCIAGIQTICFNTTQRSWTKAYDSIGLILDGPLRLLSSISNLFATKTAAADGRASAQQNFSNSLGVTSSALSALSVVFFVPKVISGTGFWATNSDGSDWRWVVGQQGSPTVISKQARDTDWEFRDGVWVNRNNNHQKSIDGKYIDCSEDHPDAVCLKRDWLDIIMEVCSAVCRILSPLNWLNKLNLIDLKEHAARIGHGLTIFGGMIASMNLVQQIRNLINNLRPEELVKKAWSLIQAALDFIACAFDSGLGRLHPVLSLVGILFNLLAALNLCTMEICLGHPALSN